MSLLQAIVLGVVQGLGEFLPVSSSGHLAIAKHILGTKDVGLTFDVLLHFGTLFAIFIAFWKDIWKLIVEGCAIVGAAFANLVRFIRNAFQSTKTPYKKVVDSPYRKFVMLIIVSTIPTGLLGYALRDVIEDASATLVIPGIGLLMTGVLLLVADRWNAGTKRANQVGYTEAGIIGLAQGIATFPGLSRSGTTITACLVCGLDKNFAVKYSFIMSVPAVLGATVLEMKDFTSPSVDNIEMINYLVGTVIAAFVGYIAIKTMLLVVREKKFMGFSLYCFLVGAVAIGWHFLV